MFDPDGVKSNEDPSNHPNISCLTATDIFPSFSLLAQSIKEGSIECRQELHPEGKIKKCPACSYRTFLCNVF